MMTDACNSDEKIDRSSVLELIMDVIVEFMGEFSNELIVMLTNTSEMFIATFSMVENEKLSDSMV
jgi:hypothetical protein